MDSYSNLFQCEICFRASQKERAAKLLEKIEHDEKSQSQTFFYAVNMYVILKASVKWCRAVSMDRWDGIGLAVRIQYSVM